MKRFVLVEMETEGESSLVDANHKDVGPLIKRALDHYFHSSPRKFRAVEVTEWVREAEVDSRTGETKRYLNSPFLDELS